jgi:hypothetical protein
VAFVDQWLRHNYPRVRRWQYDDNSGERSINLFHVHVFVEMIPFSFQPRPGLVYVPPHILTEDNAGGAGGAGGADGAGGRVAAGSRALEDDDRRSTHSNRDSHY